MPFDPIRAGDTDAFQFDLSAWFPDGVVASSVVVQSHPPGWIFTQPATTGSKITVYGTAPNILGYSMISCTASDGTAKLLTKEERIMVVP